MTTYNIDIKEESKSRSGIETFYTQAQQDTVRGALLEALTDYEENFATYDSRILSVTLTLA